MLVMAKVTSIMAMLLLVQSHWAGHGFRMEDHHLPETVPSVSTGHWDKGG